MRGSLHFAQGDVDACRSQHERALQLARQLADADVEARALSGLADALYAQGLLRSAHSAFARCLQICERDLLTRFSLMNHCMLAIIESYLGRFDDALARLARARGLAADVCYRFAEVMCEEAAAWTLVFAGRYADASAPMARGVAMARAAGARRFEAILLVCSAHVAWHDGRHDDARQSVRDAWTLSEQIGPQFAGPLVLGARARFARTPAERRQALTDGERLLAQRCVSHCYFGFYRSAAETALVAGDWSEAERFAGLLDDYARPEPLPMIDFIVARARALAAAGRGHADRDALTRCRDIARTWNLPDYLTALDAALADAA
jgi:tetratricopeptide (TPR) repeat protein